MLSSRELHSRVAGLEAPSLSRDRFPLARRGLTHIRPLAGELIHIDFKKRMRIEKGPGTGVTGKRTSQAQGTGWERSHACVEVERGENGVWLP
jgi:hypothetical protein